MIERVLVANRGEIARRVFRTCRDLGIGTVAVYSDADADSPHRAEADRAVRLPGSAPADTYLRSDLLIDAARASGADAIHPGYGFLSENAEFAQAVLDAGLVWIGPPPAAIDAMGSKVQAKELMADAGVPVLPELDPETVTDRDLPVLVKASAGGGGRGMRVVRTLAELPGALAAARAEAASAFGDPAVFCEPYVEAGRHLEVQVLADAHGTVWSLGERECSLQRRHQKVVEETPSPMVDDALRAELSAAAVAAAKAIDYVGAGTVEFLARNDGTFWFLETNTRLQVEHPVTECVTGLDLVAEQLRIAAGERLAADPPGPRGAAIEVRLYAEDPGQGWRPTGGPVRRFAVPGVRATFDVPDRPGVRLDPGVVDGTTVGTAYDPMLAKVIAWAPTRAEAAARLAAALAGARIHGLTTNRDLLVRTLRHPEFLAGRIDTGFFERIGLDVLAAPLARPREVGLAALAGALAVEATGRRDAGVLAELPSGWRNVPSQPQWTAFDAAGETVEVGLRHTRGGLLVEGRDGQHLEDVVLVSAGPADVVLEVAGVEHRLAVSVDGDAVDVDGDGWAVALRLLPRFPDAAAAVAAGSLVAPMPGTVTAVDVAVGDAVAAGQRLLVLEAMKMQHPVVAGTAGVVRSLDVVPGAQVDAGTVLAVIEQEDP
ncbi:acetyl/propionyl/methylcrotonyl-CoA carboxylase subunit alpha [Blastococcus tunisiensis]|uniref:Propionyl-CoA carboxylase alpha chain n=1 Tax=Blastococcus tunisiensis TaxID=1798228 RepID=A0A1I2JN31_9ACTN|nr:biotin carboxylase N-terminal domain-containing protein [Blastococcus sp. DSM 46838]SFF55994.1 propionyl-CoA carboxylase alpha chain [Blastococcus sp. DSM 46838]